MVGSGKPESIVTLHSSEADQDILKRVVKGVTHVKLTGDVRWGDHDGIRFLFGVRLGVEIVSVKPGLINTIFNIFRIVLLGKFF